MQMQLMYHRPQGDSYVIPKSCLVNVTVTMLCCQYVILFTFIQIQKRFILEIPCFHFFLITETKIICHLWENLFQVKKAGYKIYKEGVKDPEDNAGWFSWLWTWSESNDKQQLEVKPGSMFISFYISIVNQQVHSH